LIGRSKVVPSYAAGDGDHARQGLMRPIDAQNSPREELPCDDVEVVESRLFLSLGNAAAARFVE